MKEIHHTATLLYYDGPQIFEARDVIGGQYVGVLVDADGLGSRFLVVGVEPERLRLFRSGGLDLKSLLEERRAKEWFIVFTAEGLEKPLLLESESATQVPAEYLPDVGVFLHHGPVSDTALIEARNRNSLIFEAAVEPPEAASEHLIRCATFAELLTILQAMIKHAYGKAFRSLSYAARREIDRSEAHVMNVLVPAAAGSFRFVLEAAEKPDLVGESELGRALELLDSLFERVSDPQAAIEKLRANSGHLASAYLRFLRFLVKHNTGFRYSWAKPTSKLAHHRSISQGEVQPLLEMFSGLTNLESEEVTLSGEFEKVNRSTGTWGLKTESGVFSGKVKEGSPSLDGLRVGARYRFTCMDKIEADEIGTERHTLYLIEYRPA
jgi:hypothetical protein